MLERKVESALQGRMQSDGLSVTVREIAGRGMIDLRGTAGDRKFMAAAKEALGLDLPKAPRTSASWGDVKALWLAPDQWLILSTQTKTPGLLAGLGKGLAKSHALAVDVSDMRAVIRIEGAEARNVLLKGSSLDLRAGGYGPGTVRRFRFAEIAALLDVVEDDVFDVYVFRSYAEYAWAWLLKNARAGSEVKAFGVQDAPPV
jgi:sarcosine oxidase, subunit gamma